MTSTTEYVDKIDPIPGFDRPVEAPTGRMSLEAYDRNSLNFRSTRPEDISFNFANMGRDFGLVEYNRPGGTDFDYRRQGGRNYDYRNYVSNVYGCTGCGCNGGEGCSCWDRSRNYFNQNQNFDPNKMICGLDASGKYYGPESWRQRLFGGNDNVNPSVCGPGGCYPMDQSRNYYNGRHSNQSCGLDQTGQFYGNNRYSGRGANYNFNGEGDSGGCSNGGCGGNNRGMAMNLIRGFLSRLLRR